MKIHGLVSPCRFAAGLLLLLSACDKSPTPEQSPQGQSAQRSFEDDDEGGGEDEPNFESEDDQEDGSWWGSSDEDDGQSDDGPWWGSSDDENGQSGGGWWWDDDDQTSGLDDDGTPAGTEDGLPDDGLFPSEPLSPFDPTVGGPTGVIRNTEISGGGMIVPAYLGVESSSDVNGWKLLATLAGEMRQGRGTKYKDFWVAVTGPGSGPNFGSQQWQKAGPLWKDIQDNGGKVFGYINSLDWATPFYPSVCVDKANVRLRQLAQIKADVDKWLNGYKAIDGIWIDEYYPRVELAPLCSVPGPDYPNGKAYAPSAQPSTYLNPDGTFKYAEVNPQGGYYDQLTDYIKSRTNSRGERLLVIGNAGGHFYSNQHEYDRLVDVVCSFEDTYEATTKNAAKWTRENAASPVPQLALVHTNPGATMRTAIDAAIGKGYKYIFSSDRNGHKLPGTKDSDFTPVWNDLPSADYLRAQVQQLANHQ